MALSHSKIPYALVGGFAVSLHGAFRGTMDVDIVIKTTLKDYEAVEKCFKQISLLPRLPVVASEVYKFRKEYIENRNLIAWSFCDPQFPFRVVDVILTKDLKSLRIEKMKISGITVSVLSLDDLIEMKSESNRPQDVSDVAALKILRKRND